MEHLWDLVGRCSAFCPVEFVPTNLLPVELLTINHRSYRVAKQIGEGGYAFVYLAKELPSTADRPVISEGAVAVKKIVAVSGDKLAEAKREIEVLKSLSHVNCVPLLDHAINQSSNHGSLAYNVLLVFPAYQDGTLSEELERLSAAGRRLSSHQVLDIFRQVCAGIGHMHSRGWAHMDIKPHNVLIRRPKQQHQPSGSRAAAPGHQSMSLDVEADDTADVEAGINLVTRGYEAVVMDFGSARQMPRPISSRIEALTLQEEAEAHCTATYRAPELFDVPSHCTVDFKVDVWALGCTLYALMYGASPFQQALDQGASLALAVMNCRVPWPKDTTSHYPDELHSLVKLCLQVDPVRRPTVGQLQERIHDAMAGHLDDPQ